MLRHKWMHTQRKAPWKAPCQYVFLNKTNKQQEITYTETLAFIIYYDVKHIH